MARKADIIHYPQNGGVRTRWKCLVYIFFQYDNPFLPQNVSGTFKGVARGGPGVPVTP